MTLIPFHQPDDLAKVTTIAESLAVVGWQGPALVAWDDCLITGAHRIAAARSIGWTDAEIPTIDVRELAAQSGQDWDAVADDELCDGIDSPSLRWVIDRAIAADIRQHYGIDID